MVRINDEKKKKIKLQPPPQRIIFEYGKEDIKKFIEKKYYKRGLGKIEKGKIAEEKEVKSNFLEQLDFYIKENAFEKMLLHCYEMALNGKEAMGFLIGDIKYWDNEYSVVYDVATASLEASPYYVRFRRDAFEELFNKLDEIEYDYILVGWYHSHLGYSSFMSEIDLETQRKYFNKKFHAAVVIDPIKKEMKAFKLLNEQCIEIPYAIFR